MYLVSTKVNQGEFENKPWKNYTVQFLDESEDSIGIITTSVKMKFDLFNNFMANNGFDRKSIRLIDLDLNYDQFRNVKSFDILKNRSVPPHVQRKIAALKEIYKHDI